MRRASPITATLDLEGARATFARLGRVRLRDFLAKPVAETLLSHLRARQDWRQMINGETRVFELERGIRLEMSEERRRALDQAVYAGARDGFQFRYEAIRVPDDQEARRALANPLSDFVDFLSEGEGRDVMRAITGNAAIDFADGQATMYSPGDFLTAHDDAVEGKSRHAAYVFGLSPVWRVEWGGLLAFHEREDEVLALPPQFNTLDIFAVPRVHSVSLVSAAAPVPRISVTGWLRSRA